MSIRKLFAIISFLVMTSGCTTLGSHILSHPNTYLPEPNLLDIEPEALGFETRTYCAGQEAECVEYLFAEAYKKPDFAPDARVYYNVHATGDGIENAISFEARPADFGRINGTAVLLHGFGGDKETMVVTSIFFRSLGMDVIALDLFGHGDSEKDFAFGAKEHQLYGELLRHFHQQTPLASPLVLVGHSIGALPATNILASSDFADGAILLAPMVRFDKAAKHYLAYKSTLFNDLLADDLPQIVNQAMSNKNVSLADTDIRQKLQSVDKPVLILSSDTDSVSPVDYFSEPQNSHVQLMVLRGRTHASLLAFDNADTNKVEKWLSTQLNQSK